MTLLLIVFRGKNTIGIGRFVISFLYFYGTLTLEENKTTKKQKQTRQEENAGKATATQQEIQTTILISLVHWQDTFMQKREEAEMSSGARQP